MNIGLRERKMNILKSGDYRVFLYYTCNYYIQASTAENFSEQNITKTNITIIDYHD